MQKRLYIMAGINGSGKTTTAERLKGEFPGMSVVVSSDDYMVNRDGVWQFDPMKLGDCHAKCQEAFHKELKQATPVIIVDNTSLSHEHRWVYAKHALERGYDVTIAVHDVEVDTAVERNIHGVPRHTLETQKRRLDLTPGIYHMMFQPGIH